MFAHNAVLNLLALGPHYPERKKKEREGAVREGKGKEGRKVRGSERQEREREKEKEELCAFLKLTNACSLSTQSVDQSTIFYSMFIVLRGLGLEGDIQRIEENMFPVFQSYQGR